MLFVTLSRQIHALVRERMRSWAPSSPLPAFVPAPAGTLARQRDWNGDIFTSPCAAH